MFLTRRCLCYIALALFTIWNLLYLAWDTSGITIKESTWTCEGQGRHQVCEFTNFCVNEEGPFIISKKTPPKINMINADIDMWFQPKQIVHSVNAIRVNETVFVYGLYSPFHFSHFLYNGLMPLYSIMQEYKASSSSWTMRVLTQWNKHTKIDLELPSGKDIVLESNDVLTSKQIKPGYKPICFSRAVVGTGNRCSLSYCDNQIPSAHYASYKQHVFNQPFTTGNTCLASIVHYKKRGQYRVGILNRKNTRHITNIPELIEELKHQGEFAIRTIDFDQDGCDIVHTAQAVKDLDILIAPFGNRLGSGLFMKEDALLISISARWYNEDWFKYPMTAIGRRLFNFDCRYSGCQEYEPALAARIIQPVVLNTTELQTFMTEKYPENLMKRHFPGNEYTPISQYQKDVARRVDVGAFIPFLKNLMENKPPKGAYFPDTCKKKNVCCDTDCGGPLTRNVFSDNSAWI